MDISFQLSTADTTDNTICHKMSPITDQFLVAPDRRNVHNTDQCDALRNTNQQSAVGSAKPEESREKLKQRKRGGRRSKVITMLIAIVSSFAICWFWVFLLQFLAYFHPYYVKCPSALPSWAFGFAIFMQHCNSAITPLLYFGFSYTYRRGFRESFIRRSKGGWA